MSEVNTNCFTNSRITKVKVKSLLFVNTPAIFFCYFLLHIFPVYCLLILLYFVYRNIAPARRDTYERLPINKHYLTRCMDVFILYGMRCLFISFFDIILMKTNRQTPYLLKKNSKKPCSNICCQCFIRMGLLFI